MSGHDELSGDHLWLNSLANGMVQSIPQASANEDRFDPRGVVTDEQVKAMDDRNRQRAAEAARRMGTLYTLHPVHRARSRHVHGVLG